MSTVKTKDGAEIFYKDWGQGPVVMFSHGWPLNADAWEDQLFTLASHGYRAIAHDRRGHGRSSQTWEGNDMDTYADDMAAVVQALDLRDVTHVGHSTGGGEVTRYIGRHGTSRVKAAVLVSAIPPTMLKTDRNPGGLPISVFDDIRKGVATDRSQYYHDLAEFFYSANRPGSIVTQGIKDAFWLQSMQAGLKGSYDCVKQFSESVFYDDLAKFDVPTLIIHGDDDQIVPIDDAGRMTVNLVGGAVLKVYAGAPHGLMVTHRDRFNADLLEFIES
ncbi:alpha/beta fold hydrolase [Sphingomonas endolithica]|uniref:alpha/beta fold hydrolase n=1 Tax=Sphingomonas endolithica TaxID=2972485 RepID=UPI0021B00A77|nr:alpha/beta hydrolase [Sphingomonas sp. ZFBP2030]